jgi:hypothetical protein
LLADALYALSPTDGDIANAVVSALNTQPELWGVLDALSLQMGIPFPGLTGLIETAASGSADAILKLLKLTPLVDSHSRLKLPLVEGFLAVAESAPEELLGGLLQASAAEAHTAVQMIFSKGAERGVGLKQALEGAVVLKVEPQEKVLSLLQMLETLK